MTTNAEVRELAAKSAAEIRRRGWAQTVLFEDPNDKKNCRVCALGAILAADEVFEDIVTYWPLVEDDTRRNLVRQYVQVTDGRVYNDPWVDVQYVYEHNDNEAKNADDVLAVFDKIAAGE